LGHARTFLIAWLAARSGGGRVILRIEDLDATRTRPEAKYNPAEKGFRIDNLLPFWRFLGPEGDRTPSFHLESSVSPCVAANLP
jgi:hypothetical protein